jgi:hypothetical protein
MLNDTGSTNLTFYQRDLDFLDPAGVYPLAGPVPITTANGTIFRKVLVILVQLLDHGLQSFGNWFREQAVLEPDSFVVNEFGNVALDGQGNPVLSDFRLSGCKMRSNFFFATGVRDRRLLVSSNKSGLRHLPA